MSDPFASYFNDSFNFDNRVAPSQTDRRDLSNFQCNTNGVMLEPRLQEYLKKKKFYKSNHVDPPVSLEKQYLITDDDRHRLKQFFSGNNDMYTNTPKELVDRDRRKAYFPSRKFRDDPKYKKVTKPDMEPVPNMGMFAPDDDGDFYEVDDEPLDHPLDHRDMEDRPSDEFRPMESLLDQSPGFDDRGINDPRTKYARPNRASGNWSNYEGRRPDRGFGEIKNPKSGNQWNPYFEYNYKPSSYGTNRYDDIPLPELSPTSTMDLENHTVIPNMQYRSQRQLPNTGYQAVPFMGQGRGCGDVDLETSLQHGMPSRTMKSYGYRNPEEHYFDYIDDTMQRPEHVIFPIPRGGVATRLGNRKRIREVPTRDIY